MRSTIIMGKALWNDMAFLFSKWSFFVVVGFWSVCLLGFGFGWGFLFGGVFPFVVVVWWFFVWFFFNLEGKHRIALHNVWHWRGYLEIFWSTFPAVKVHTTRASCPGLCSDGSQLSPRVEMPQLFWAACTSSDFSWKSTYQITPKGTFQPEYYRYFSSFTAALRDAKTAGENVH